MSITQETFSAFLKCNTKSYLIFNGIVGVPSEFSQSQGHLGETYKKACRKHLCSVLPDRQRHAGTPDPQPLENLRYSLVFDYVVSLPEIHAQLDALEELRITRGGPDCAYIPLRFVPREKLSIYDKLLLAFDAFAFSQAMRQDAARRQNYSCLPIRNGDCAPWDAYLRRFGLCLAIWPPTGQAQRSALVLNKHCAECEFRSRCRQTAIEKDDLSLLPNISEKERKKQNDKGIFTVMQLSYTFRSPRSVRHGLPKHQHALKALALRKNQIHILGSPPSASLELLCISMLKAILIEISTIWLG